MESKNECLVLAETGPKAEPESGLYERLLSRFLIAFTYYSRADNEAFF